MSGSPFVAAAVPLSPHSIFEDLTLDSNMDSSSPVGSEIMHVSTGEYQLFPEDLSRASTQSSPPSVSLPFDYRYLSQIMSGVASIAQSSIVTPPRSSILPSLGPSCSASDLLVAVTSIPVRPTICVASSMHLVSTYEFDEKMLDIH